jgi:hypothetical protein
MVLEHKADETFDHGCHHPEMVLDRIGSVDVSTDQQDVRLLHPNGDAKGRHLLGAQKIQMNIGDPGRASQSA